MAKNIKKPVINFNTEDEYSLRRLNLSDDCMEWLSRLNIYTVSHLLGWSYEELASTHRFYLYYLGEIKLGLFCVGITLPNKRITTEEGMPPLNVTYFSVRNLGLPYHLEKILIQHSVFTYGDLMRCSRSVIERWSGITPDFMKMIQKAMDEKELFFLSF